MNFDSETLELLQSTARKAAAPQVVPLPGDGRTAYVWSNGEMRTITIPPDVRNHQVRTLSDLTAYVASSSSEDEARIWHDVSGVVAVLHDEDRRDRIAFPLTFSPAWMVLTDLDNQPKALDQKMLIKLLKTMFGLPEALVAQFRKLDWESRIQNRGEVRTGRESLGRDVESQVAGTAGLPEDIVVSVPIYQEAGERALYEVRLLLDYDVQQLRIHVQPQPDCLRELLDAHQASIRARIEEELRDYPTYYGSP